MTCLRHPPRAFEFRLVISELHHDDHARQIIRDEVGDCADCWRSIAEGLASLFASRLVAHLGVDGAFDLVDSATEGSVDACALDARDWGVAG